MLRALVRFFVVRPVLTLILWVGAVGFGVLSYTTLLPRDGFPAIDIPIAVVSGAYLVDDPAVVDAEVASPIGTAVADHPRIDTIQSFAQGSSFSVVAQFQEGTSSAEGAAILAEAVDGLDLPDEAIINVSEINAAQFLERYDLLVGVFGGPDTSPEELEAAAATLIPAFEGEDEVAEAEVVELISRGFDPATGQEVARESDFNLLTTENGDGLQFRPSIALGVVAGDDVDSLGIRDATDRALAEAEAQAVLPDGFEAVVAIDFATQIRQQIGSLQSNVLTGIVAVAIVTLLLISWRASAITALFIVTVLATTMGVLFLVGISLNTISLFGVILALGLLVDDAIVITEAIAAENDPDLGAVESIDRAIGRVGSASLSGTVTTLLVFAPMLMITGILGSFIRILPISVITALTVSVILSFVFIPVAARYLVIPAPNDRGWLGGVEHRLATAVADLSSRTGGGGWVRALLAVGLSLAMTVVGLLVFAPRVGFNIFPQQKDSNFVSVDIAYPPGTSVADARDIAQEINQLAADALGEDLVQGYTYIGNERGALSQFTLTDMGSRPPAPELVDEVLNPLTEDYERARVTFAQISAGPPELTFPFQAQVYGEDIATLTAAADEIATELEGSSIERTDGTTFTVVETEVVFGDQVARTDTRRYVEVRARYDADDVTTTTALTQDFLTERFDADRLDELGLAADALEFDLGLESDNQESFSSLPIAFGVALLSMLLLLVFQFRSTVLWLLIFLAIPFSFFGVFGGLLVTDNVISFFVMLGLIGLIGIAVNNTILLTDYANQARRQGEDRRGAVRIAVMRRFRPLVATSLTTVAGLLPLALSDPFWEGLGFTIIFGLLSSTFLVLIAFPFYYLGIEFLRDQLRTPWRATPALALAGVDTSGEVATEVATSTDEDGPASETDAAVATNGSGDSGSDSDEDKAATSDDGPGDDQKPVEVVD